MKQQLTFKYTNSELQIGFNSWKEVYLLRPDSIQMHPEVYRGTLTYRANGANRRFQYSRIKTGLVKRKCIVEQDVPDWL